VVLADICVDDRRIQRICVVQLVFGPRFDSGTTQTRNGDVNPSVCLLCTFSYDINIFVLQKSMFKSYGVSVCCEAYISNNCCRDFLAGPGRHSMLCKILEDFLPSVLCVMGWFVLGTHLTVN
jgi:hypothetical protein